MFVCFVFTLDKFFEHMAAASDKTTMITSQDYMIGWNIEVTSYYWCGI